MSLAHWQGRRLFRKWNIWCVKYMHFSSLNNAHMYVRARVCVSASLSLFSLSLSFLSHSFFFLLSFLSLFSVCVYIIYIYIYIYIYICGAFNKIPDFFGQAFKIVIDPWKFSVLLLYILWDDWPIFIISASNEQLQQQLEYTLLKPDYHSWWIPKT